MRSLLHVLVFVFLLAPTAGWSQPFEPQDDEAEFSAAAMKHAEAGDFEAAIDEAQKAVAIRGLNVFWLNLGRFQQRAGRCASAMTSFTNAMTAPPVTNPEQKLVQETAQKYVAELAEQCPPQVILHCTPSDMRVVAQLDGGTRAPTPIACDEQLSLGGGTWKFVGTYGNQTVEATQELRIARNYDVPLVIDVPVADTAEIAPTPLSGAPSQHITATAEPAKPRGPAPVLLLASAGLVAATGLALDLALATSHNGELDGVDFVPLGLYLSSIGLVVAGVLAW